jgi:hypothetical protein
MNKRKKIKITQNRRFPPKFWTEEEKTKLIQLWNEGKPVKEIARILNRGYEGTYSEIKKLRRGY